MYGEVSSAPHNQMQCCAARSQLTPCPLLCIAYCGVARQPFCDAAYRSVTLLQSRGLDAVINDSLVSPVTQLGSLICGAVVSVTVGVAAYVFLPAATMDALGGATVVFVVSFLVSAAVVHCSLAAVNACVTTLFVCLAEDPQSLASSKPDTYHRLSSAMAAMYDVDVTAQADVERQYGSVGRK